jgi:hypothetical protein
MKKSDCCKELREKIAVLEQTEFETKRDNAWKQFTNGKYVFSEDITDSNDDRLLWRVEECNNDEFYNIYLHIQKKDSVEVNYEKVRVRKIDLIPNSFVLKSIVLGFFTGIVTSVLVWCLL